MLACLLSPDSIFKINSTFACHPLYDDHVFENSVTRNYNDGIATSVVFHGFNDQFTRLSKVLSGGVACNEFLRAGIEQMCARYNCSLICPPARLCTDNGVMIAW